MIAIPGVMHDLLFLSTYGSFRIQCSSESETFFNFVKSIMNTIVQVAVKTNAWK